MKSKILYKLRAVVSPACWFGGRRVSAEWDAWLWNALVNDPVITDVDDFTASVDGVVVWIANHPYSSGYSYRYENLQCTRATAYLLGEKLRLSSRVEVNARKDRKRQDIERFIRSLP